MNIISWNVNGARAIYKKGYWEWFRTESPDIICLQETKCTKEQLPEDAINMEGYISYFVSPIHKKGYSGVAIYTKIAPEKVEYGMGIEEFDTEGRLIAAYFKDFILLNVYFPNGGGGPERLEYKLKFYDAFLKHIEKLRAKQPNIIFTGDVNTAHKEVDLARPKENEKNTGFLPIERAWIDQVVEKGYVDVFRKLNPDIKDAYTYWDMKTFARERNVGWRIDYFFVSSEAMKLVKGMEIKSDVLGSDHCPIELEISL